MRRREFCRRVGAGIGVAGSLGAAGTVAAQTDLSEYDPPEHVTISYDEARLKRYRPWLAIDHLDSQPYGLYGQVAESPEYDYDVFVYAARYALQDGVSPLAPPLSDSHFGDTEWLICYANDQGEVAHVAYTAYHWVCDTLSGSSIPLYDDTHPMFFVVNPWHNYVPSNQISGEFVELRDMTDDNDGFESWLRHGMAENLRTGCINDPINMLTREHFWRSGFDARYAELFHDVIEPIPFIGVPSSVPESLPDSA